jgi:simple sugar transport system permease protein
VACIFVGADAMSRSVGVPNYIADVVVATSLLCMLVSMLQLKYRIRWQ